MVTASYCQSAACCRTASAICWAVNSAPDGTLRTSGLSETLSLTFVPPTSTTRIFGSTPLGIAASDMTLVPPPLSGLSTTFGFTAFACQLLSSDSTPPSAFEQVEKQPLPGYNA